MTTQNGRLDRRQRAENYGFRGVFRHDGGFCRWHLLYFTPTLLPAHESQALPSLPVL